jgi:integrase
MPVRKLDAAFVQLATCPEGKRKIEYRDTQIVGFSLEVRSSGGRTYYLRYFNQNGRQRQYKIGGAHDIRFDQAKKAAKRLRADAVLGGDPLAAKQEKKAAITYAALAEQHVAHAKTYQRSWWSVEGILRTHIVPRWGRHRLDEITSQDIAKWLAEKAQEGLKPATIEKIRVVMGKSFALAAEWELPGSDKNPVRRVKRPKFDNKRERYLTAEEALRLRAAVEKSTNRQLKHIVGLLLLTGARVSELLHARWQHIDVARKAWLIPISKTGKARRVPLSPPAIEVIRQLPRFEKCDYLVPNPATLKPFVSIKGVWQTARKRAGLEGLRIHDLRHSAASFMINAGVDLYAVGKVLGHADHKSTMRYSHLADETLLAAVEAGANKQAAWTVLNT